MEESHSQKRLHVDYLGTIRLRRPTAVANSWLSQTLGPDRAARGALDGAPILRPLLVTSPFGHTFAAGEFVEVDKI